MSIDARRDPFQAIADPTRRQIIDLLAKGSMNLNAIAENFDISRPAVSQQIKILTECGLVIIQQKGRQRYCEAQLTALREVSGWIEQYRVFWEAKMDRLGDVLNEIKREEEMTKRRKRK